MQGHVGGEGRSSGWCCISLRNERYSKVQQFLTQFLQGRCGVSWCILLRGSLRSFRFHLTVRTEKHSLND